ncbi:hypothetical protein ACTFIW_008770 [Dictyostelium discoideum]
MVDLTTSIGHQLILHEVAKIPSLPTTVCRRTRSKLTKLGVPNFCQEVVNGLKVHLLPNFKPMPNPISFSIPEGPISDCITKEVQDLLLDDAIEQVFPNRHSKRVFYSNVFTVPKQGTTLHRPVLDFKRLNTYINNQSFIHDGSDNNIRVIDSSSPLLRILRYQSVLHRLLRRSITFLGLQIDSVSMKLLGKLISLKGVIIPFRLYTRRTNKFHSQCLTLANGYCYQLFPIPQKFKSEISHWLTVLKQWNGKEISLFPSYDYVLTTDASESGTGATLKKGKKIIKTWLFQLSTTQSNMTSNRREMLELSVRTTLETIPQEESKLDWRAYSRILQCKSRPPLSNPTSIRSNPDGTL